MYRTRRIVLRIAFLLAALLCLPLAAGTSQAATPPGPAPIISAPHAGHKPAGSTATPAAASFWVQLVARDPNYFNPVSTVPVGTAVQLNAWTNADVGPTPYYIMIFDNNSGAPIAICSSGTSCSATVTFQSEAAHRYVAFVSYDSFAYPPSGIQAVSASSEPWVTWTNSNLRVQLGETGYNGGAQFTASANQDVGPTPYYIEIFAETRNPGNGIDTGSSLLAWCGSGTTCTATNVPDGTPVTAFISPYATVMPPGTITNSLTIIAHVLIP